MPNFEMIMRPEVADVLIGELADNAAEQAAKKACRAYRAAPSTELAAMADAALQSLPRRRQGELWARIIGA